MYPFLRIRIPNELMPRKSRSSWWFKIQNLKHFCAMKFAQKEFSQKYIKDMQRSSSPEKFLEKGVPKKRSLFSCKIATCFQSIFSWEHLRRAASVCIQEHKKDRNMFPPRIKKNNLFIKSHEINAFKPNVPFLYLLRTSEKL